MCVKPNFNLTTTCSSHVILQRGFSVLRFCMSIVLLPIGFAQAGTLEGTVRYLGIPPNPKILSVAKDQEYCGKEVSIQTIHLDQVQGGLRDVVVSIQGLDEDLHVEAKERAVLNMRCAFTPRIGIARKGQEIEVLNQDPILHNTHITYGKRTILNVAQVPGGKSIVKKLKHSGLHEIRCDKHVFMSGYLHVFPHHYYAQTDQSGAFRITGIPPGRHTILVWHEILGVLKQIVTIPSTGVVQLNLSYQ